MEGKQKCYLISRVIIVAFDVSLDTLVSIQLLLAGHLFFGLLVAGWIAFALLVCVSLTITRSCLNWSDRVICRILGKSLKFYVEVGEAYLESSAQLLIQMVLVLLQVQPHNFKVNKMS